MSAAGRIHYFTSVETLPNDKVQPIFHREKSWRSKSFAGYVLPCGVRVTIRTDETEETQGRSRTRVRTSSQHFEHCTHHKPAKSPAATPSRQTRSALDSKLCKVIQSCSFAQPLRRLATGPIFHPVTRDQRAGTPAETLQTRSSTVAAARDSYISFGRSSAVSVPFPFR
jgi:hypothetical protein